MQVVSGPVGKEKVHFDAPPAAALPAEIATFLPGFNAAPAGDALIHAGLAHLWLVTLHPLDDGNGRISRAVGDMALARAEALCAATPPQGAKAPLGAATRTAVERGGLIPASAFTA